MQPSSGSSATLSMSTPKSARPADSGRDSAPWYKHRWPWLLMAGPAAVIVAGAYTTFLAVTTSDGLVVDDYYKEGKAINMHLARDRKAAELGAAGELSFGSDGALSLTLTLSAQARAPQSLRLSVLHPTIAGHDQIVLLTPVASESTGDTPASAGSPRKLVYRGKGEPLGIGQRSIQLEDDLQTWRIRGQLGVDHPHTLTLQASAS